MAKLLHTENIGGGRFERWWLHTDDVGDDVITVETTQDVEPIFKRAKMLSQINNKDLHFVASIPCNVIDEICRIKAVEWGMHAADVLQELTASKTDRCKKIWKMLCYDSDFKKFQRQ